MSWKNWIFKNTKTITGGTPKPVLFGMTANKKNQITNSAYNQTFQQIRTAVSNGTSIEGRLAFDAPVKIDGSLLGEVYSSDELVIGPDAKVQGQLQAGSLVVFGKVSGNITASGKVTLLDGAKVEGDVICQSISFTDGATFNGYCRMPETSMSLAQKAIA